MVKKYICQNCKEPVLDKDRFCSSCGAMFDTDNQIVVQLETEIKRLLKEKGVAIGVEFAVSGNKLECWFTEPVPGFTKKFLKENFPTSIKKQDKGNFALDLSYFDSVSLQDSVTIGIDPDTDNLKITTSKGEILLTRNQAEFMKVFSEGEDTKSKQIGNYIFLKLSKDSRGLAVRDVKNKTMYAVLGDELEKVLSFYEKKKLQISKTDIDGNIVKFPVGVTI